MDYALIVGEFGDGFQVIGPFKSPEEATRYAESDPDYRHGTWWIALMQTPSSDPI